MNFEPSKISQRIEEAVKLDEFTDDVARDVAFHMTDWLEDLAAYAAFCERPDDYTSSQVSGMLLALLLHAPNHIAAAAKLYTEIPVKDIFGVGAVETTATGSDPRSDA